MANFAELDENDVVINVVYVDDDLISDDAGKVSEQKGIEFLNGLFKSIYLLTSEKGEFRGNMAQIGQRYVRESDVFAVYDPVRALDNDE